MRNIETSGSGAGVSASNATASTPGLVRLSGVLTATVSSAGDTTVTLDAVQPHELVVVTAETGAGGYVRNVPLETTNVHAGALATVRVNLPASNNPRVCLRNATAGGTLLGEAIANGIARTVTFRCVYNGTAWEVISRLPAVEHFDFTRTTAPAGTTGATGTWTWTMPVESRFVDALWIGGGSGGGSGRRGAAGTNRSGGGGGAGSNFLEARLTAPLLSSLTVSMVVGAGGAGGAAVATDDTNGASGAVGTSTSLTIGGITMRSTSAPSSAGGGGGITSASAGAAANGPGAGTGGATGSSGTGGTANASWAGPSGGGGGGGLDTGNSPNGGGPGGSVINNISVAGGAAGAPGSAGSTPVYALGAITAGGGGGGGGGQNGGVAGAGGNGTLGSGGGGGGASANGTPSGAGGNGGDGIVRLTISY